MLPRIVGMKRGVRLESFGSQASGAGRADQSAAVFSDGLFLP